MCIKPYIAGALLAAMAFSAHAIEVNTAALNHDVDVWYATNETLPIVDVAMSFEGAGTASDPKGKEGLASFAAAMLTEGAGDFDALSFARALEEKAIRIDATTTEDRLVVRVHALREHAETAGSLLTLALTRPHFAETDIARIRDATLSELALLEEDPNYLASRQFNQRAFSGHPYANPPYGTKDSVAAFTADDLRGYLAQHMARSNVLVVASGHVDQRLLKAMLGPLVTALPTSAGAAPAMTPVSMQGAGELVRLERNLPQSVVMFGAPGVARSDPKFYAAYLLNHIIGGNSLVSRLAVDIRQKQGLAYSVGSGIDVRKDASLLTGELATRAATTAKAVVALQSTLQALHDTGVTSEECNEARSYTLGSFPLDLDSSRSVSSALLMMRVHGLGQDYLEKRNGYFTKVSCDEVNALATELLDPKRFLLVTVGAPPPAEKEKP